MATPPANPCAIAFSDRQNLFRAAKDAFGYFWPNYDVAALARAVCVAQGWALKQTRFYTGVPDASDNPFWNHFWRHKLNQMHRTGVVVYRRSLRYRNQRITINNVQHSILVAQEKGIDVRIALDLVRMAHERHYDVGIIFSQDQDLTEAVKEIKLIAGMQNRPVRPASAYPASPTYANRRGVDKTDWIHIDRAMYDACIDSRDYRPKKKT